MLFFHTSRSVAISFLTPHFSITFTIASFHVLHGLRGPTPLFPSTLTNRHPATPVPVPILSTCPHYLNLPFSTKSLSLSLPMRFYKIVIRFTFSKLQFSLRDMANRICILIFYPINYLYTDN